MTTITRVRRMADLPTDLAEQVRSWPHYTADSATDPADAYGDGPVKYDPLSSDDGERNPRRLTGYAEVGTTTDGWRLFILRFNASTFTFGYMSPGTTRMTVGSRNDHMSKATAEAWAERNLALDLAPAAAAGAAAATAGRPREWDQHVPGGWGAREVTDPGMVSVVDGVWGLARQRLSNAFRKAWSEQRDDLAAARQAGVIAYNAGRPNVWHADPTMIKLVPARLRGFAVTESVTRAFGEAWEDQAQHDRALAARQDAERVAEAEYACAECGTRTAQTYVVTTLDPADPTTRTEVCRDCDRTLTPAAVAAQILAEFDAWRDERADLSAAEDEGGADWSESDDKGCDLAQRLADALRETQAPDLSTRADARSYLVGLPVCVWVADDGAVTYDVDTAEAGSALWADTSDLGDQEEPLRTEATIKADQARVERDHNARMAARFGRTA